MTVLRKFLADVDVDGKVKSTLQGNLLGSFTDMPTASATNLGLIVLYVGQTTSDYDNNNFYMCEESEGVYSWNKVQIQGYVPDGSISEIHLDTAVQGKLNRPINNPTITIQSAGTSVGTFTLNQSNDKTINIPTPTVSYPVTDVQVNNTSVLEGTVAKIPTIPTQQQMTDWSNKYDKPPAGIPKSDLTELVQTSLGKADSAYQKPELGIPETDLDTKVQGKLDLARTAYQKDPNGIPSTDMTQAVKDSLALADTAYQKPNTGIPIGDLTSSLQTSINSISGKSTVTSSTNGKIKVNGADMTVYDDSDIRQQLAGLDKSYVINNKSEITGTEDTTTGDWTDVEAIAGVTLSDLKIGDNIYLKDTTQPDYWVSAKSSATPVKVALTALDTKTDLSNYYTKSQTYSKSEVDTTVSGLNTEIGKKAEVYLNTYTVSFGASTTSANVTATGVTSDSVVIVAPTQASSQNWYARNVYCSGQSANTLTFACTSGTAFNVTVTVIRFA